MHRLIRVKSVAMHREMIADLVVLAKPAFFLQKLVHKILMVLALFNFKKLAYL
jgi:hypothetical protein